MSTKELRRSLSKTLEQAGLGNIKIDRIKWLAFADANIEQNARVHRATNDLLLKLVTEGTPGRCIHVTGEMRALLDPFHRDICSKMFKQSGNAFAVLYNLPRDQRTNRNKAIGWSLKKWSQKGRRAWPEYLRTLDVIAERAVDVHASTEEKEIQYSVFGNRYTQLQEKHADAAKAKRVWLLESDILNEALTDRGERLLNQSLDIDEGWYSGFLKSLGGLGARAILSKLADGKAIEIHQLDDDRLAEFGVSLADTTDALNTMGFAATDEQGRWMITKSGTEYLNLLTR
ncbi:hypothetical protein LQG66_27500 [Bradyrhizobium ontarionense]|uniref:Uncharacterized protein n=1 Tax=Bradyrhizobium ontarionense TaxID=2898149 RepID=A0ABY3R7E5_9BRAD|nr:hypothetical protein [Bradyrhizobium sp. A19]UFZ02972.1 hypothetical protein LQG66_27500 [Bradyrhizobium sp. A19]